MRIWVSRANDKSKTIICACQEFEMADELGRRFAKSNKTTFFIREYAEIENMEHLLENAIEMRQKIDDTIQRVTEALK